MNTKKTTLVVGASTKPERYSNKAIRLLTKYGHPVVAVGLREGEVAGVPISKDFPAYTTIDTVTLYLGPARQEPVIKKILSLKPKRIIFNPGTENNTFRQKAEAMNIETVENCTLVMLNTGTF